MESQHTVIRETPAPQMAPEAAKPGAYELAIRVRDPEVTPGDPIELEAYIVGYGYVDGVKLGFYAPPYFIDERWSSCVYGLGMVADRVTFGTLESAFDEVGALVIMSPGGLKQPAWPMATMFFDVKKEPPQDTHVHHIATEIKVDGNPPFMFRLSTHKGVPTGSHELRFYLTYFNGVEWRTDSKSVSISVPNWFKRNEALTWTIGLVTFIVTVAGSVASIIGL